MNEKIDIPLNSLNQPGNIWINKSNRQLRYSLDKNDPSTWIQPLSVYQVGNDSENSQPFVKRGQPVSIGFIDELNSNLKVSGDPCIVPTNPHLHQWCIGLSLEPGNANLPISNGTKNDHVHILSHGQIEYNLSKQGDEWYQPPHAVGSDGIDRYLWTYEDIGKPVMVSNYPGEEGGLTIDITHAYHDGANILTVGRIADAPVPPGSVGMPDGQDEQKVVIEVQLAGDVRGMIDSTQFAVHLSPEEPLDRQGNPVVYNQSEDRLIFVKVEDDPATNKPLGIMIINDEVLLAEGGLNSPVGCFVAKSINGQIALADYADENVIIHRLGIVEANFGRLESEFGKDIFLVDGEMSTVGAATAYEYKVGVVLGENRILVDCRYPRLFAQFEMIGRLKPAYKDIRSGVLIADPGYVVIDPNVTHKVSGTYAGDTQYPLIDFSELIKIIMYQGIIQYSDNPNGPFTNIDGTATYNSIANGYFRFKETFYSTADGDVNTQIKFSNEGAPDNIQYLWPEMFFNIEVTPTEDTAWTVDNSPIRFNISYLVNLGEYIDGNSESIESYDITCRLPENLGGRYISPGIYTVFEDEMTKWCGYEWAIYKNDIYQTTELVMVTNPNIDGIGENIPTNSIKGFCYPPGQTITQAIPLHIVIRRRPIQYHNLFLNQLNASPWYPYSTGHNVVTNDTLYFGEMNSGVVTGNNETTWTLDWRGANAITFNNYQKAQIDDKTIYKKLLKYTIGPYFENALTETKLIDQLIVQYQPVNLSGDLVSALPINWIYDFKDNYASLSAKFGAKYITPPATKDISGNTIETFVEDVEDYQEGKTNDNLSGNYTEPRSALKTLHEIPTQIFSYSDDPDKTHKWIGTVQEGWDVDGGNLNRFRPYDFEREIFPKVNTNQINGTSYKYDNIIDSDKTKEGEWQHIIEEINFLFNVIERPDTDFTSGEVKAGGDILYLQSNLGLLNQAAKETQDRLLRLERSLFGLDYETMPNGLITDGNIHNFVPVPETLHDGGISRELNFLYNQGLINTPNNPTIPEANALEELKSDYNTFLWEFYGDYITINDYISNAISSGYQYDMKNHFHDVYIWYLASQGDKGKQYNINNHSSVPTDMSVLQKNGKTVAIYDARKIYFNKYYSGYYTDSSDGNFPRVTTPFTWPLVGTGVDIEKNFFDSAYMGLTDYKIIDQNGQDVEYWSVEDMSLEGVMWDTIAKLSWIKNTTDVINHNYHPDFVNVFPRKIMGPYTSEDNNSYRRGTLIKKSRSLRDSFNYDLSKIYNANLSGLFSAFTMISGKIHNSYQVDLLSSDEITNVTNKFYKNPTFDLLSKSFLRFEEVTVIDEPITIESYYDNINGYDGIVLTNFETNIRYLWETPSNGLYIFKIIETEKDSDNNDVETIKPMTGYPPEGYYDSTIPIPEDAGGGYYKPYLMLDPKPVLYPDLNLSLSNNLQNIKDIYFHFPSKSSGKVPYAPQQYIENSGIIETFLGEFVMAHNNRMTFGRSGYQYFSGVSGRMVSGILTIRQDAEDASGYVYTFNGFSGYTFDGVSGSYYYLEGNPEKIDRIIEDYSYEHIIPGFREALVNSSGNFTAKSYLSGTYTDVYSGLSGIHINWSSWDDAITKTPINPWPSYWIPEQSGWFSTSENGTPTWIWLPDITTNGWLWENNYSGRTEMSGVSGIEISGYRGLIMDIPSYGQIKTEIPISIKLLTEDVYDNHQFCVGIGYPNINDFKNGNNYIYRPYDGSVSGEIYYTDTDYINGLFSGIGDYIIDGTEYIDDIPPKYTGGETLLEISGYKQILLPKETLKRNEIHFFNTAPNYGNLRFPDGFSTRNGGPRIKEGQVPVKINVIDELAISGFDTWSGNLRVMSEALPPMTGIVDEISGFFHISGEISGLTANDMYVQIYQAGDPPVYGRLTGAGKILAPVNGVAEIYTNGLSGLADFVEIPDIEVDITPPAYGDARITVPGTDNLNVAITLPSLTMDIPIGESKVEITPPENALGKLSEQDLDLTIEEEATADIEFDDGRLQITLPSDVPVSINERTITIPAKLLQFTGSVNIDGDDKQVILTNPSALTIPLPLENGTVNFSSNPVLAQLTTTTGKLSSITGLKATAKLEEQNLPLLFEEDSVFEAKITTPTLSDVGAEFKDSVVDGITSIPPKQSVPILFSSNLSGKFTIPERKDIYVEFTEDVSGDIEIKEDMDMNFTIAGINSKLPANSSFKLYGPKTVYLPVLDENGDPELDDNGNPKSYPVQTTDMGISGWMHAKIDRDLLVNAESGFYISGNMEDYPKFANTIRRQFEELSGEFYVYSGILWDNVVTVESDLNEKPVTMTLDVTDYPGWITQLPREEFQYRYLNKVLSNEKSGYLLKTGILLDLLNGLIPVVSSALPPALANLFSPDNMIQLLLLHFESNIGPSVKVTTTNNKTAYFSERQKDENAENNFRSSIISFLSGDSVLSGFVDNIVPLIFENLAYNAYKTTEDNIIIESNSSLIMSGYYHIDQEIDDFLSGWSYTMSGSVDTDDRGYWEDGYDKADQPIKIRKDDISGLISGNYNKINLQKYRNSGIIYGIHLQDDVDLLTRIKRKEHIKDSLQFVVNSSERYKDKYRNEIIYGYTKEDVEELKNNMVISSFLAGVLVEFNEPEKFKNYSYSIFKRDIGTNYARYEFRGISDSNRFYLIGENSEVTIVPGICTDLSVRSEKGELIQQVNPEATITINVTGSDNGQMLIGENVTITL
jgi:hypothetical protein